MGCVRSGAICERVDSSAMAGRGFIVQGGPGSMESILSRFVRDESGDFVFTILMAFGFVASFSFLMATLGGIYDGIGNLLYAATR
jgi:Flp pilus assembly pilin Flp